MPRLQRAGSPTRHDPMARWERVADETEAWFHKMLEINLPADVANRPFGSRKTKAADDVADYVAIRANPAAATHRIAELADSGLGPERAALEFARWMVKHMKRESG